MKSFAASVAEEMAATTPEAYVATMSKAKRSGKIFIDYFRNDYTATAIADYAVRARARRACRGADRMEGAQGPEISERVHDERRAETNKE